MAEPVISRGTSTSSMGGEEDGAHAVDADEPEIHEMPWRPLNADSYLTD